MSSPIFLHIGMPKTGTSSIQQFLHENRSVLRREGVVVSRAAGRKNHKNITLYALANKSKETIRRTNGLMSQSAVDAFREAFLKELTEEAADWKAQETVVLSGEHMSRLQEPEEFTRLKELLSVMGRRPIRVVIYLRRQDLYYLSGYSQRIKNGGRIHWSNLSEEFDPVTFDYEAILGKWTAAFGKENIIVRVFERSQLLQGDLIADFLSVVGCGIPPAAAQQARKNESLDARSLEYLRRLNEWYPRFVDGRINQNRRALVSAMEQLPKGPSLRMSRDFAVKFLTQYEESNARIARQYLGRDDGRLFFEVPSDEAELAPTLSMDDAIEIGAKLWAIAQKLAIPELRKRPGEGRGEERKRSIDQSKGWNWV